MSARDYDKAQEIERFEEWFMSIMGECPSSEEPEYLRYVSDHALALGAWLESKGLA